MVIKIPYCSECGEKVSEDTKFCPECGAQLGVTEKRGLGKSGGATNTSLGLEENVEGALAYLLGFVSGIVLYLIEEDSRFVRFHAMQSTVTFLGIFIVGFIFSLFLPFIWFIFGLVSLVAWLIGMIKAYQGELYKFPVAGEIAENQLRKGTRGSSRGL